MRLILALLWVTLTTASTIHYTPTKVLLAKLQGATASEENEQAPATTQYHDQDSDGFYSYGYSAGRSAKAEYLTLDGSSHGFYSYIDANGKLQTVKYEAGRSQGFKATGTNLPKAPKTPNRFGPPPVRDTPEVQEAKKAHFEAYREAELREALAQQSEATRYEENESAAAAEEQQKSEQSQQEVADILENTRSKILAILSENANAGGGASASAGSSSENAASSNGVSSGEEAQQQQEEERQEENNANDDGENAGLLTIDSLRIQNDEQEEQEERQRAQEAAAEEEEEQQQQDTRNSDNYTIENAEESNDAQSTDDETSRELSSAERQMTTYKLKDYLPQDDQVHTQAYYTFDGEGESSKDLLRLSELQEKSDLNLAQQRLSAIETVRVPVHSYYTVLSPSNKYTVVTPTTHQFVPRKEALKRGHSLPISLSSSYLSHRLRSK